MSRFRSILLALLALLVLGARPASAVFQFDIRASDMENVSCWDPDYCLPTAGWIHLYNLDDPQEDYTVQAEIFAGGFPLAYSFECDADALLDCNNPDLMYGIDEIHARFQGFGGWQFEYEVISTTGRGYECGPAFPVRVIAPPGDGCEGDVWCEFEWTQGCLGGSQFGLTEDFTVPVGETLVIGAGMEVFALPGARLFINGDLEASGTDEAWITFHGNHWGGLVFGNGASATLEHCRITGVDSQHDGGALTIGDGVVARLDNCLIDHNTTAGAGGAAKITDGGALIMFRSTVSHNTGAGGGGVHLAGGNAYFESSLGLITFNEPANSDVTGAGFTNVIFTDVYPQWENFPAGMSAPEWCDPGYVDADNFDFHVSYWSVINPQEISCAYNLGAFPFDMHQVLSPAHELAVTDREHDNGGFVLLSFRASPNDGADINPITLYSLWERQPGMAPGQWLAVGSVAALNDAETVYTVQLPTLDDQWEGHENLHAFRVGAHSVDFGQPAFTAEVTGFSVDNEAPPAPTGLTVTLSDEVPGFALFQLMLDASPAHDFDHFLARTSFSDDFDAAVVIGQGSAPPLGYVTPLDSLAGHAVIHFWVSAVDAHGNEGSPAHVSRQLDDALEAGARPAADALEPASPNPWNPSTVIPYRLARPGLVRLTVYNLAGEQVATLVDGVQAAGRHEVTFSGNHLASGVYLYRLETPTFTATSKMILAR